MTNYIWDSDDYPWDVDPGLDILKLEYDKLKEDERTSALIGTTPPSYQQTSSEVAGLMKKRAKKTAMPLHVSNVQNSNQSTKSSAANIYSVNKSIVNLADKTVQRSTPLAPGPNPATTIKLKNDVKAKIIPTPFHNTSTEQQTRDHYLSGNGSDVQLTDEMFKRAANFAQYQLGKPPKDGSQVVSFYDSPEFNGTFGRATVHIQNGEVVGIEDYYDFDPKPWGERGYLEEIGTR